MLALNTWNGGVIIISHDERFITSVAKEVRDGSYLSYHCSFDVPCLYSSGYVEMARSRDSRATCRLTRLVGSYTQPGTPLMFIYR